MFIGREKELKELNALYTRKSGGIAVVYGRRRIGKSTLISQFVKGKRAFFFEGLEGVNTKGQLVQFANQLQKQFINNKAGNAEASGVTFSSWNSALSFLTSTSLKKNDVIVFDELQWMSVSRSNLISLVKYFWDNYWNSLNITLILCGSIASFMINRVLNSKALYGRISLELPVQKLAPNQASQMLGDRSYLEKIKYLMLFGGVPKYLEEINLSKSFAQNIQKLCFEKNSLMLNEFQRIFYSQFKDSKNYEKIATTLSKSPKTNLQISEATKIKSGGGLKSYLNNMETAEFISCIPPYDKTRKSKNTRYVLSDEYLRFYFHQILPHLERIKTSRNQFFHKSVVPSWKPWLGLAFERFCYNNAYEIASSMGFSEEVDRVFSYVQQGNSEKEGVQIDLVYSRFDKVIVLTEVKFYDNEISTRIIPEMESKFKKFIAPKGYTVEKALICLHRPSLALIDSEYFHHIATVEEILAV